MEEWWRDDPKAKRLTTVVLDYDSESYRRAEPPFSETSRNLLPTLFELGGTLFSANFGAEYFRGLEDYSEDRSVETSRVEFTKRELPPASNHFLNFLGFFERDFRIFDFYLGMLDARRALALDVLAHDEIAESDEEWKVLRCFAAWERESERFQHEPGAGSLPECDALGVGEWRYPAALASAPKQRTEAFAPRYKPSDRAAASRAKPTSSASAPEVGFQGALYEQLSGPKRCQYNLLRLLAASQRYRTLLATRAPSGLTGDTVAWFEVMDSYGVRYPELDVRGAEQAKRAIRDVLYRQLRAMAAMQSSLLDRAVTRLSVSTLANQIEFREPLGLVSIGTNLLRGVELGVGGRLDRGFLRGELQFVAHSIYLRKEYGQRASLGLRGRLVLTLGKFTGPWVQVEPFLGAHAHWGVSSQRDWFGLDGELGSYVVLLQRIYLSLAYTYRHAFGGYPPAPWPRTIDSHSAAAEVGFRFLW
jgi:hypothetical protein